MGEGGLVMMVLKASNSNPFIYNFLCFFYLVGIELKAINPALMYLCLMPIFHNLQCHSAKGVPT